MKRHKLLSIIVILYSILLFIVLTIWRLPPDLVTGWIVPVVTGGRVVLQGETVSMGIPFSIRMKDSLVGVKLKEKFITERFDQISAGLEWKGLFGGYLPMRFYGKKDGGEVEASFGSSLLGKLSRVYIELDAQNLSADSLDVLRSFASREVRGKLNGRISVSGNLLDYSTIIGNGQFKLKDGSIQTNIDIPGVSEITYQEIAVKFNIDKGILNLTEGRIKGDMFSGVVSGEIQLKNSISRSLLNLKATLVPGKTLMNISDKDSIIKKLLNKKKKINVIIRGTISRPSISIQKE